MRTEATGSGQIARPPQLKAARPPDAAVRPTARVRPIVPVRIEEFGPGYEPSDPYVRRFWVAAIGSSAVADCLRLIRAAQRGSGVRLPRSLPVLVRVGLAQTDSAGIVIKNRLPEVPVELRWRFPPGLAAEHTHWGPRAGGKHRHQ